MDIHKWDVWLADLSPKHGTEPGKMRPVVVIQTDLLNKTHPSTIICPFTTIVEPEAEILRVHVPAGISGLEKNSDILVDQIRAIDNQRFVQHLGSLSDKHRELLSRNLAIVLDLF